MIVAAIGILVNGATALMFMRGRDDDLNIRATYLHMAADAGVSLGVVVATLIIMATGWLWVDPAVSLGIAAVVLASGWGLARDSVNLALDGVPRGIDLADVKDYLARLDGVTDVHDLHVWAMSTDETALTAHLVRPDGFNDAFLHGVCEELAHRFRDPARHPADRVRQRCLQACAGRGGVECGRGRSQITPASRSTTPAAHDAREHRQHAELEAEDRGRGRDRQHQRRDVDARQHRHVEGQPEARAPATVSRNSVCSANQIERLRMTPTTAAVIAESAPASPLLPRRRLDVGRAERRSRGSRA